MIQVLLLTIDKNNLTHLASGLGIPEGGIQWAFSGEQALAMIQTNAVDLVVTDELLGDMTGLAFVEKLVKVNPMINCAAVSALSKSDFHEASEGLGILMQLPMPPSQADGKALMGHLKKILGLPVVTGE